MVRFPLLGKLLGAVLVPTVLTFAGFGLLGHLAAQRALEAELGRRLSGIAAAAAAQVPEESVALLAPGDEGSRTYRNLRRRLVELRDATAVARLYLFNRELTSLVDTEEVPIGTRYYSLDSSRAELRGVFAGRAASSVLFRGRDGQMYKSGYAPIPAAAGGGFPVGFAVGVDGSAALYRDLLELRKTLLLVGGCGALAMVLLAVLLGRRITRPLLQLTRTARAIGQGELHVAVPAPALAGRDEVAVLAQGLEAMREALSARDERLQMMLSGIAHEVRNPLGGMELFAGLLRDEIAAEHPGPDRATAAGYVARIEKEIGHLKAVVGDFLEYARRPRPDLRPVDLGPLLEDVAECVRATAPQTVAVEVAQAPGAGRCLADATQLRRALLNLAHNAVQACAAAGKDARVTLGFRPDAGQSEGPGAMEVLVSDTGPGIPADALPKIWAPFFTTRQKGTGLGLAFVREIIADHGGTIAVDTGAAGTTFTLRLCAAPESRKDGRKS